MYFEAYHASEFGENILSVSMLSRFFTIELSSDETGNRSFCCITSKQTGMVVFRTDELYGLYKISVPKRTPSPTLTTATFCASMNDNSNTACIPCVQAIVAHGKNYRRTSILHENQQLQWHFRTGHTNPNRYLRLAETFPYVQFFPRRTQLFCIPCQHRES